MSISMKMVLAAGVLVLAAGCTSEETLIEPPSKSTLGERIYEQSPALNQNVKRQREPDSITISDRLTFSDALAKALLENPQLQSYAWQVRVKEAERIQASLLPNPEIEAEMENFGGTGPFESFENREMTIKLGQKVLLGADRMKAKRVAALNKELAGWDYETVRLHVLTKVTQAFISAVEAQQQLNQQQELVQVAEELFNSVSAQVEAGKVSKLAETKAEVELARARIDLENARNRFDTARSDLASYWGSEQPRFRFLGGELDSPQRIPAYETVVGYIQKNPEIARWVSEVQQREAVLSLEKARGIPDIKINAGYKRAEDLDAEAAIVGISIPLPFFNRNQGNVKAAEYELNRVTAQKQIAVTEIYRAIQQAYHTLEASYNEVQKLQEQVLPGAERAFEAAQIGYREGKFDYLEVLDAQRTLFSSRTRYVQALAEYNRTVADLEQLIGTPLDEVSSNDFEQ